MRAITASWVFDGVNLSLESDVALVIDGDTIVDLLPPREVKERYPQVDHIEEHPGCSLIPGWVNCHSHMTFPGDGRTIEEVMETSDEIHLLQAARNGLRALSSGVTTLTDLGGRNEVMFQLRGAIESGVIPGPRLILAGRPITSVRGHCWQMNAEVATVTEMQDHIRGLFAKGADLLKVMATGGGTLGTDPYRPQFTAELLDIAQAEANQAGKPSFAHCSCTEAIRQVVDAGFDVVVHGNFKRSPTEDEFDKELIAQAVEQGVYWNPTLEVTRSGIREMEQDPTVNPQAVRERWEDYSRREEEVARLRDLGVLLIAGSDEGWRFNRFGRFDLEIEAMAGVGMSPLEALHSASMRSAEALGISEMVGSLEVGKKADFLVIDGQPSRSVRVKRVFLSGEPIDLGDLAH